MRGGKGGDGVDQSEYGLNVVDQFPNTGRSVRIGMDTKSFYTFTFFLEIPTEYWQDKS